MYSPQNRVREPAINLPGLLIAFIVGLLAIQGVRGVLPPDADSKLVIDYGFAPARLSVVSGYASRDEVLQEAEKATSADPGRPPVREALAAYVTAATDSTVPSFFSYSLIHGSWMHVIMNCIWLAAFGTPVVRRCGVARSVVLAAFTSVGGALAYWLWAPLSPVPVVGASGVVSGFMGAATSFVFTRPDPFGLGPGRAEGPGALLRNRPAMFFLGTWLAVNLLTAFLAEPLGIVAGAIAWQAHLGGLVIGLLLFPLLDPVRSRPGGAGP